MKKIGIVVGEASGDILGAGLIKELQQVYPDALYEGIGGHAMLALGFNSLFPQDRLAVMGLVEPLKRLPELLSIRKKLFQHFSQNQFDIVIGIDAPDFNLTLEKKLKQTGINTVHYVSPSVWAWRQGRIKKIAKAVDLMLTLLPFENTIYEKNNIPVQFVGHPLADKFPLHHNHLEAQMDLGALIGQDTYHPEKPLIACLPGSRHGEVKLIGPVLWQALEKCLISKPDLQIIVPAVNLERRKQIEEQLQAYPDLPINVIDGHSHEVMAAADMVLLASGTTALEAMLLKKPMVVVYKMASLSYRIIALMLKTPYVSLPNLLANKCLVPELIQDKAEPDIIANEVLSIFNSDGLRAHLENEFTCLHKMIRCDANKVAAKAIISLLEAKAGNV